MKNMDTPMFSREDLRRLLIPLLLEQLLSVSMGMADTIMVAGVGEAAVSSVSLVDSVNVLIIQVLAALATGGAVIASQYLGRRDVQNAQRGAAQLCSVLLMSTVGAAALVLAFRYPILRTVFGAIDDDVMRFSETYFLVSALSYPFMGLYNAGAALFRAQGDSRTSMTASLVMNVINIAGNALLIYGAQMGVLGAAVATLIGRVFAAAFVMLRLQRRGNPLRIRSVAQLRPDASFIGRILAIGVPSGIENAMFHIGKLLVSSLTSTLGTTAIAANAVLNSVCGMANIPGSAVGLAMIPVVGQCVGAGEKEQARAYTGRLMRMSYIGIAAANVITFVAIPWIARWFSLSPEAQAMTVRVMRSFNIAAVLFWPASFTLPNALRAGGDTRFTMLVSMTSMWSFRVLLCYLFVQRFHLGLLSIWVGMYVDWVCRSVLFYARYRSGKWMEHRVI